MSAGRRLRLAEAGLDLRWTGIVTPGDDPNRSACLIRFSPRPANGVSSVYTIGLELGALR